MAGEPLGRNLLDAEGSAQATTRDGHVVGCGEDGSDEGLATPTVDFADRVGDERHDHAGRLVGKIRDAAADFLLGDALVTAMRVVEIGHLADEDVAQTELPSDLCLGLAGHAHDVDAAGTVDGRLGWGGELGARNDHQRPLALVSDADRLSRQMSAVT